MSASTRRLVFVDVLRSLAIALALAAHAINDFGIPSQVGTAEFISIRLFTRIANPSFIFMFGMMLEFVYARKLADQGMDRIMPRLLWRSFQCYLGYAVTVCAGWVMGLFGTSHFLHALALVYGGQHGNILKFYTFALVLAIPLLAFRHRFGLLATIAVCLSVWLFNPLLDLLTSFSVGRFHGLRELLIQTIPHNLTFIVAGMLVGNALRTTSVEALTRAFYRHLGWVAGSALLVTGLLVWQSSPREVLDGYLDYYQYRITHHIGYYVIGLLQVSGLCLLLFLLLPPRKKSLSPRSPYLAFGRSSLLAFTLGNVILNVIVGLEATDISPYAGLGWTLVFLSATLGLVIAIEQFLQYVRRQSYLSSVLIQPVESFQSHKVVPASQWLHSRGRKAIRTVYRSIHPRVRES